MTLSSTDNAVLRALKSVKAGEVIKGGGAGYTWLSGPGGVGTRTLMSMKADELMKDGPNFDGSHTTQVLTSKGKAYLRVLAKLK